MKLYNTLSKKIEDFKPFKKGEVSLYTCGPTVYDHVHIGNLRAFINADVLRRALGFAGYKVKHTMNLTDVDDKTIRNSQSEYSGEEPKKALKKLTRKYEKQFAQDSALIGNDYSHTKLVRATDHLKDMEKLIQKIHSRGFAYISDDGVYFDLMKYMKAHKYGVLSHIDYDPKLSHHRIDNDEYDKDDVRDFALWKTAREGGAAWEIEIGGQKILGRPGWHIECSAMSTRYLGQPFDIHTGGVDLIFPHHENEIAQSVAAEGTPLANVFFHNEHLLVDGHKMSKSEQNYYVLGHITDKGYDPMAFRLLVLQTHYRSKQNFTFKALDSAHEGLIRLREFVSDLRQSANSEKKHPKLPGLVKSSAQKFRVSLENDLDTVSALGVLFDLVRQVNRLGLQNLNVSDKKMILENIDQMDEVLGLRLTEAQSLTAMQKELIQKREAAKAKKDYETADKIRNQLHIEGIELKDTSNGTVWVKR